MLWALSLITGSIGCTSTGYRAPVEERVPGTTATQPAAAPAAETKSPVAAVNDNAGKPGFVTVKPGDTLIRIALDAGQNWRDIVRWNNLDNPDTLQVGQVLRVLPPTGEATGGVAARPVATARVEARPLETKPADARPSAGTPPATAPGVLASTGAPSASTPTTTSTPPATQAAPATSAPPATSAAAAVPSNPTPSVAGGGTPTTSAAPSANAPPSSAAPTTGVGDDPGWIWPANGTLASTFDGGRNKGVTIAGKLGDPIVAAADGRVIYAGSSLRGYGNMVIIKHNNNFITAYAHNKTLLVKDEQAVRKGQRIAEMGSSDAERVQLHFELRKDGQAIDPLKHLPAR
jgi:lipoprotein NlpD